LRKVVRVASYVPTTVSEDVPVGAPDEDAFTFGATAVERARAGRREEPGPVSVHLFGEFPSVADWGFSAVLGRGADVVRHPRDAGELVAALRSLEEGTGAPAFLVAAELPERVTGRTSKTAGHGAAAVAYLLEDSEESIPFPFPKSGAARTAVSATLRLGDISKDLPRSVTFVGDWDGKPSIGWAVDKTLVRKAGDEGLAAVSEGAYVPRPRYLENLPSRWRFLAEMCGACQGTTFPARGVCRRCGRTDRLTPLTLPYDGGRVVAVTTVGKGGQPTEFDAQVEALGPYDVALVELARGMRVTLQATDAPPGSLKVGDRVDTRLRRLYPMEGEWRYGRKAVPVRRSVAPSSKA
jgi:uncharacterized OB-fold protein